ncbi:MAG: Major Facilitator Superfamily protein [Methanobacterium sp. PtaB.Bin024]|jgi:MFS family permease|nr:MAG: Major Facilitator Superfamily protein [Methanobacterium sp. PtaB.Bin024]OPY29315.1 MAG: Major Facilitator Superfamily protein [Methanobacterium sp. PtaU1.Bin242]
MNNFKDFMNNNALKFIILIGVVSLFADMTYEGARSITGPYLAILGASAVTVGFVAGFGELAGYVLRFFSGRFIDSTGRYWAVTIGGYLINLIAVPLLALAGSWEVAAVLIITERLGKGIRVPSRDVMLSHACSQVGQGWGFGLHEALDQIGAILGPLIVAAILFYHGSYQLGFAFLLLPAVLAILVLVISRFLYPHPHDLEVEVPQLNTKGFKRMYWLYVIAAALIAAGFADFALIAYHFQKVGIVSAAMIPIFYALAMGTDGISALIFGKLFDKVGLSIMIVVALISSLFAPLVFLGGFYMAFMGMVIWGVSMGAQESIMRSSVAVMSTVKRRGSAYGVFQTIYGVSWFAGSLFMGALYDFSVTYLVVFSVLIQLISIPVFISMLRIRNRKGENI